MSKAIGVVSLRRGLVLAPARAKGKEARCISSGKPVWMLKNSNFSSQNAIQGHVYCHCRNCAFRVRHNRGALTVKPRKQCPHKMCSSLQSHWDSEIRAVDIVM